MTNDVKVSGKVATGFTLDHEYENEKFYRFYLHSKRTSGSIDVIPVIVSEKLIDINKNHIGVWMDVYGQFRSFNLHTGDKTKLLLYVFVSKIEYPVNCKEINSILLEGKICKIPNFRETPNGRLITDLLIGVNRNYNKSDYIPCIAWGRNAVAMSGLEIGSKVRLTGRIQSREYTKDNKINIAYEISVNMIESVD